MMGEQSKMGTGRTSTKDDDVRVMVERLVAVARETPEFPPELVSVLSHAADGSCPLPGLNAALGVIVTTARDAFEEGVRVGHDLLRSVAKEEELQRAHGVGKAIETYLKAGEETLFEQRQAWEGVVITPPPGECTFPFIPPLVVPLGPHPPIPSEAPMEPEVADAATTQECDLCGDQGPLLLHAVCHLTAPLRVTRDGDLLVVSCYVPSCGREVARFRLAPDAGGPPYTFRVVETDNFGRDYPNESFAVTHGLSRERAQTVADFLNERQGEAGQRFFKVVENDYKLEPGFEP